MAKLIVSLDATKIEWLCYILKHRTILSAPGALLFSKREGMGTFTGDAGRIGRLRNSSQPAEKLTGAKVAKSFGADSHIPLDWVASFEITGETLSIVFHDGINFSPGEDRLFFRKDEEEAFVPADWVQTVCRFGNTLEVLWKKQ